MVKITDVSYGVGDKQILNNVSLDFQPGEFSMILGPNGSGKSTLLKIFSGEIKPSTGSVRYCETDIASYRKHQLARIRAVMSQQPELAFPLAVEEVVMMGRYPFFDYAPSIKDKNICKEVIEKMQLNDFTSRNYLTLSGGEKQRVQFARVLAQVWDAPADEYRYLFLDEPLTSLDINYQQEFLSAAKSFLNSKTVLVAVMHDINLALQYADRIFFLKNGELAAHGKPENIISTDLIRKIFNVETLLIDHPIGGHRLIH